MRIMLKLVYNIIAHRGDIMKFERKIYQKLLEWKCEYNGTKALLIEGARRIGF